MATADLYPASTHQLPYWPSVRLLGHATPHAWAVDAWVTVLSRGGGLVDIAGYLAILTGYAVALFALASFRLRRSLVTP